MPNVAEVHDDLRSALGRALRTMRKARQMTRAEMAEKAGLTQAAIRAWEGGRNVPSLHNLETLCQALGVEAWRVLRSADQLRAWDKAHRVTPKGEAA